VDETNLFDGSVYVMMLKRRRNNWARMTDLTNTYLYLEEGSTLSKRRDGTNERGLKGVVTKRSYFRQGW